MTYFDLSGKVVIITGAGSGIGRATAIMAAHQGATVIVSDINDAGAAETVSLITAAGGSARAFVGDVGDEATAAALVAEAMKDGHLDGVVNNAGIMDYFAGIAEADTDLFRKVFHVNVDGPFFILKAAMEHLLASKGAIVNVSSEAGIRGAAAGVIYTMSKHAIVGLTRNTAYVYARQGVRCNAMCPGGVETNIVSTMSQEKFNMAGLGALQPVHQGAAGMSKPEQQAALIVFLLSDEAANISGAIIPNDGGWSAG